MSSKCARLRGTGTGRRFPLFRGFFPEIIGTSRCAKRDQRAMAAGERFAVIEQDDGLVLVGKTHDCFSATTISA
jgi:hypothetical protein